MTLEEGVGVYEVFEIFEKIVVDIVAGAVGTECVEIRKRMCLAYKIYQGCCG